MKKYLISHSVNVSSRLATSHNTDPQDDVDAITLDRTFNPPMPTPEDGDINELMINEELQREIEVEILIVCKEIH